MRIRGGACLGPARQAWLDLTNGIIMHSFSTFVTLCRLEDLHLLLLRLDFNGFYDAAGVTEGAGSGEDDDEYGAEDSQEGVF